jgi:predicted nucleotidyltransferase
VLGMLESTAHNDSTLRDRIEHFLSTTSQGREAIDLLDRLTTVGDPCIFGGMVRDIARGPEGSFTSDIDIVIDCDPAALDRLLADLAPHRNRFGGYRLQCKSGQFDLWALSNTWAIKEGHVKASSLSDLTKTTFFSWDSAVYLYRSRELATCRNYYAHLDSGVVDLNLRINPSVLGAVARTLRILADWKNAISPRLTDFLFEQLTLNRAEDIVAAQKATIGHVSFNRRQLAPLRRELSKKDFFAKSFRYEGSGSRTSVF